MSRKTRKLIWSAPLMAVLAVAGALAIFVALVPNDAQADHEELPGAVSNLVATADGENAVDLTWSAPTDGGPVTGYRIDLSHDGQAWMSHVANTNSTATSYRDTMGVQPGAKDRFYQVFAINSAGTGLVSNTGGPIISEAPEIPGNVTGVRVRAIGQTEIEVTWNAPADDGGTAIKNYLVAYAMTEGTLPDGPAAPADNEPDTRERRHAGHCEDP